MGTNSNIQWTDATWNVARGCTKVSEGCKFCYMMREADWRGYKGNVVTKTKTVFRLPLTIKVPSKIFTSSLTDFFHEDIDPFRDEAWDIIRRCPQHTFQILTKRPERIAANLPADWWVEPYPNVWLGVSVEDQKNAYKRIPILLTVPAVVHFLSCEPLLGELDLKLEDIEWVIVGGESGFGKFPEDKNVKWQYRMCELDWIEGIVDRCTYTHVPVFVKQLGTDLSKMLAMSDGHGGDINEFPINVRVRQFPNG